MLTRRLHDIGRRSTNPRPLGVFRAAFGVLILLRSPYLIDQAYQASDVGVLGAADLPFGAALVVAWLALGVGVTIGWRSRTCCALLAVVIFLLLALDPLFYNNHLYLMGLVALLLACADSGAAFSLDRHRRGGPKEVPNWPVFLLKAQVSIIYLFAAISKLQADFISGLSLHVHLTRGPFAHLVPEYLTHSYSILAAVAGSTIVIQSFLMVGLWSAPWRSLALGLGFLLHAPMVLLANSPHQALRLLIFSALMWGLYMLYLDVSPRERVVHWDPTSTIVNAGVRLVRRLDWFQAFTFDPCRTMRCEEPVAGEKWRKRVRVSVVEPDGQTYTNGRAAQKIASVLPIGYVWAPLLAVPLAVCTSRPPHDRCRRIATRS